MESRGSCRAGSKSIRHDTARLHGPLLPGTALRRALVLGRRRLGTEWLRAGCGARDLDVDPAGKQVTVDGTDKRKATIDKFEVWFKNPDGNVISISRSTKTWRLVVPIEKADDSRKYLYFEGDCKLL